MNEEPNWGFVAKESLWCLSNNLEWNIFSTPEVVGRLVKWFCTYINMQWSGDKSKKWLVLELASSLCSLTFLLFWDKCKPMHARKLYFHPAICNLTIVILTALEKVLKWKIPPKNICWRNTNSQFDISGLYLSFPSFSLQWNVTSLTSAIIYNA